MATIEELVDKRLEVVSMTEKLKVQKKAIVDQIKEGDDILSVIDRQLKELRGA